MERIHYFDREEEAVLVIPVAADDDDSDKRKDEEDHITCRWSARLTFYVCKSAAPPCHT